MSVVFCCTPVSSTNKTDCHDITEILLKVVLNTITLSLTYIIGEEGTAYPFGAPEFTPIFSVWFMFLSNVAN
jgi:hypothetical protein